MLKLLKSGLFLIALGAFPAAFAGDACSFLLMDAQTRQSAYDHKAVASEEYIWGQKFDVVRFPSIQPSLVYYSFDVPVKKMLKMTFGEMFMKFIRPAITEDYVVNRYKVKDVLEPLGNEILVGFDRNHTYLLLYDSKTGKYTRADSGTNVAFSTVASGDSVVSGLFLRFSNTSVETLESVRDLIAENRKYMTCTQGTCRILSQVGIQFGNGAPVDTTYKLIEHLVNKEIKIDDPNVVFDVFTLDPRALQTQAEESQMLSRVNEQVRRKDLNAFLIIGKSFSKTFKYWFLNKVGAMPMPSNAAQPR